jgi:hypothetical protein
MPIVDSLQSNKQHAVPQNIMDVEFKLVGDLTMRQFAYLCVFGGAAYVASVTPTGVFKLPLMAFLALLGLGLAFVPIQERGLDQWIVNFFKAIYSPTQRIWKKEPTIPTAFLQDNLAVVRQELITLAPTSSRRQLEEYLNYQQGQEVADDPLDIKEKDYVMKVRNYYTQGAGAYYSAGVSSSQVINPDSYSVISTSENAQPLINDSGSPVLPTIANSQPGDASEGSSPNIGSLGSVETAGSAGSGLSATTLGSENRQTSPMPAPAQRIHKPSAEPLQIFRRSPTPRFSIMTPDMHSGRRFTHALPSSGDLILPVRENRILPKDVEEKLDQKEREKAEQLQNLLSQIKDEEGLKKATGGRPSIPIATVAKKLIDQQFSQNPVTSPAATAEIPQQVNLQAQQAQPVQQAFQDPRLSQFQPSVLTQGSQSAQQNIASTPQSQPQTTISPTGLREEAFIPNSSASNTNTNTNQAAQSTSPTSAPPLSQNQASQQTVPASAVTQHLPKDLSQISNSMYIPPLTSKPNIISGVVKDPQGKIIEGVLMMIKNYNGETVRAFKSNRLGQFVLSTPLMSGKYTLEVSSVNDMPLMFDIISFEAKGEVLPPIELVGR